MIRVLLDTCLLVKGNVSNILLDFGKAGLIAPHWTPEIGAQFVKNWARRRVEEEAGHRKRNGLAPMSGDEKTKISDAARERALARLVKLELLAPEWRIPGWDLQAATATYPKATMCARGKGGDVVHAGDYAVALAAIKLLEVFPEDEIWLATENIHHLPPSELAKYGVWSLHQSLLIEELHKSSPMAVEASLEHTLSETGTAGQQRLEMQDMIYILAKPQHFGSPTVAAAVARSWNIATP
jgi:hypothetical protein